LPTDVIARAQAVLTQLEAPSTLPRPSLDTQQNFQFDATLPKPHPILDEVRQMDLFAMTPLDALNRLADLQRRLAEE
jgi:DNA mismatch repair protein MutS